MKKVISISLTVFLVMGAVVLFTGGIQASAEEFTPVWVSKAWTGQWSCSSQTINNSNNNFVQTNTIRYKTIYESGKTISTDWLLYQLAEDWVSGVTYQGGATIVDETGPTIGFEGTATSDGNVIRYSGRCIGRMKDQYTGVFLEATCINAVTADSLVDYIEEFQCSRTVTPW
jgi:hypothetical protein